ncbi:hypothetical protein QBC34DRAFT_400380 [Podospora aff. communis PSN243]|uniref:Uncharacterized protein n=1 Tax=Podospora aff. communis PSN243 TaxID=3040156 RepID=A0AAV9GYN3_9PEZI|nr:hypothetical protein QBC34DRAFT_400380 [Podospora aff. communis PSN243]
MWYMYEQDVRLPEWFYRIVKLREEREFLQERWFHNVVGPEDFDEDLSELGSDDASDHSEEECECDGEDSDCDCQEDTRTIGPDDINYYDYYEFKEMRRERKKYWKEENERRERERAELDEALAEVLAAFQSLKKSNVKKVPIDPLGGQQFILYWANHAGRFYDGDDPVPGTMVNRVEFYHWDGEHSPSDSRVDWPLFGVVKTMDARDLEAHEFHFGPIPAPKHASPKVISCDTDEGHPGYKVNLRFLVDDCLEIEIPKKLIIEVAGIDSLVDHGPEVLKFGGVWWDPEPQYLAAREEMKEVETKTSIPATKGQLV